MIKLNYLELTHKLYMLWHVRLSYDGTDAKIIDLDTEIEFLESLRDAKELEKNIERLREYKEIESNLALRNK